MARGARGGGRSTASTVEGFIDLLVADGDELVVVDYKTDTARTDAELDAALERYRPQGAAYALALEHVLGRPVSRCVFVFARPQGPGGRARGLRPARARSMTCASRLGTVVAQAIEATDPRSD